MLGVSKKIEMAIGLSMATVFVLTFSSSLTSLVDLWILKPLHLEWLQLMCFIFLIAGAVQISELLFKAYRPMIYQSLGIYLPLITTNCAVLGLCLLNIQQNHDFISSFFYSLGAAIGFGFILIVFSVLRTHMEMANIPKSFQGAPIAMITLGIIAMIFMGFSGVRL